MSALNNLLSKSISDLGHDELRAVIQSAQAAIGLLRERSDDQWLWIAEMNFRPWLEQEKRTLSSEYENLLFMLYFVELSIVHCIERELDFSSMQRIHPIKTLFLSPAELRLIIMIDADLGRRIGDELDGVRPL
jgi:hypothetical protein